MPLSLPQKTVCDDGHRFRVGVCGRRWGKSHVAIRELARFASKPNQMVWYVSPSYRMSRQIIWDKLKNKLIELRWVKKINESDLRIELKNNSVIALRGADNFDSLRGVGLDFLVLDEVQDIDSKAFTEVLRPTLSDRSGGCLFLGTPKGVGNFLYDLYQRGQDATETQWASWQYTTESGGMVPAEELESARRDLDARTYEQEYCATFITHSGLIYYNFDRATHVKKFEGDVPKTIYVGADFNVSPTTCVIAHRTDQGLHVFDEIVMFGSNTDELAQEIRNRYPTQQVVVFPDPAGAAAKTSAGGRTDISILQNAGFTVKFRRSHPRVRDRINAVNSLFQNSLGEHRLFVDPKCKNWIECLEKHQYREGTQIPEKNGNPDYSHANDAAGYMIEFLFPITRDVELQEAGTWNLATSTKRTY